jgi:hypothetical protein
MRRGPRIYMGDGTAQANWTARQAIADLLAKYCRGIDRCDPQIMKSAFWEDGRAHYGIYDGDAHRFAELTVDTVRDGCQTTMHFLGNSLVEISGNEAAGETYVMAYHSLRSVEQVNTLLADPVFARTPAFPSPEGPCSFVVGSRYLDRFTCRNSQWRIQDRTYVWDWCERGPPSLMSSDPSGSRLLTGRRNRFDPSYALFDAIATPCS